MPRSWAAATALKKMRPTALEWRDGSLPNRARQRRPHIMRATVRRPRLSPGRGWACPGHLDRSCSVPANARSPGQAGDDALRARSSAPQQHLPSRGPDVVHILVMGRAARLRPHRAKVDQFAFQALDLEPQRRATRKNQRDHAARWVALVELDCEQVEHRPLVLAIDVAALDGVDAVETQRGAAALELCGFTSDPAQSKRARLITSRFSAGRQWTSATLTVASCRWVETTSRSSRSRAASLRSSMGSSLGHFVHGVIRGGFSPSQGGRATEIFPRRHSYGTGAGPRTGQSPDQGHWRVRAPGSTSIFRCGCRFRLALHPDYGRAAR